MLDRNTKRTNIETFFKGNFNRYPIGNLMQWQAWICAEDICGQSYKASTIVIYDSRVVNYERKLFIRLATVNFGCNFTL